MKRFILAIILLVAFVAVAYAQDMDEKYWELNGKIPKSYGRLTQTIMGSNSNYFLFEANDGTIRIVEFVIWDKTNHYISKVKMNKIERN